MTNASSGNPLERAAFYASGRNCAIVHRLGFGQDGTVFQSSIGSAIKVFDRLAGCATELEVYKRLREDGVSEVCGHSVPQLLNADEQLRIVEMSIVQPPYVLDFAKATIDVPPDFPEHVMAEREAYWADLFDDRWPKVVEIMQVFERRHGVYLLDPKPANIAFSD